MKRSVHVALLFSLITMVLVAGSTLLTPPIVSATSNLIGVPLTTLSTITTLPPTYTPIATPQGQSATSPAIAILSGGGSRYCSTTPIIILDNNPAGTTGTLNIPNFETIGDLNVIVTATHPRVGDLQLEISHSAESLLFFNRPGFPATLPFGCTGANLPAVVADDEGTDGRFETTCQNTTPAYTPDGHYIPEGPLSLFDGYNSAGTWTLTVSDHAVGETGQIDSWCVEFNNSEEPIPTATATSVRIPDINVVPNAFVETHADPPQVTNRTINIQNTVGGGLHMLYWTIAEDAARVLPNPNPIMPHDPNVPSHHLGTAGGATTTIPQQGPIVADGSFEAGTPNPEWEEFSTNFGTPLCDTACGTGGGMGPRTGAWWARFGGSTIAETGILTQSLTIPSGYAELSFWLKIPDTNKTGFLSVRLDDTEIFRANETTTGYDIYAEVTVDISAFADGGIHELIFFGATAPGADVLNFLVDDVGITMVPPPGCMNLADIPWLTVNPTSGTTTGSSTTPVRLTFDSVSLAQGTYHGSLCINSNDPDESLVVVPITLDVDGQPTAIDLNTFNSFLPTVPVADLAVAGLLLLAGVLLILRRK